MGVGLRRGPLVVASLITTLPDQDVAQARHDDRRPALATGGVKHADELAGELLATEREQLDEDHARRHPLQGAQDLLVPQRERPGDAPPTVATDEETVRAHPQRRDRDDLDAGRWREPARHGTTVEQDDPKPLAQPGRQRKRTHQVTQAERVLTVEQHRGTAAHVPPRSSQSASSRSLSRTTRPSGRIRLTARSARSVSRSADAVYHRISSPLGRLRTAPNPLRNAASSCATWPRRACPVMAR